MPLGLESHRYADVVEADRAVAESGGDFAIAPLTFDAYADPTGAQLFRELVERVWPSDTSLPTVPIGDYRDIVQVLDLVPPGPMVRVGHWILAKRNKLDREKHWQSRTVSTAGAVLLFVCDDLSNHGSVEASAALLGAFAAVRAEEIRTQTGVSARVLAVTQLVAEEYIDYMYLLMREPLEVTEGIRNLICGRFGSLNPTGTST